MRTVAAIVALTSVLVLAAAPEAGAAKRRVPQSFAGVMADGPLLESSTVKLQPELDAMVGQGVESLRVVVDWSEAQPYARFADVPPSQLLRFHSEHGVPTDLSATDRIVGGAALRHISVLPVVIVAPRWAARHPGSFASPPKATAPYARFAAVLARRYGPGGSFWVEHPELPVVPVRLWQFWNEPSVREFWSSVPWQAGYVALLRAARRAVRQVDPGSRFVLAGLPNTSWPDLRSLYEHGARRLFDIVAIHPFTAEPKGVITILEKNRAVMARHGDSAKPMMITELSWTSALGRTAWRYGNETTAHGQAENLTAAMRLLVRARHRLHLRRVYWYTWLTRDHDPNYPFDYAGLSRLTASGEIVRKPAYRAFRHSALAAEGCTTKRVRADRCAS